jgi:hypothetical protein
LYFGSLKSAGDTEQAVVQTVERAFWILQTLGHFVGVMDVQLDGDPSIDTTWAITIIRYALGSEDWFSLGNMAAILAGVRFVGSLEELINTSCE